MTSTDSKRRRPRAALAVAGLAGALVLSGCGLGQLELGQRGASTIKSTARITVAPTPDLGAGRVSPDKPVVVTVASGRLTDVVVTASDGTVIVGRMTPDSSTWTAEANSLNYDSTYLVSADAVDRLGVATGIKQTLQTLRPSALLTVRKVNPSGVTPAGTNATVGVGFPMKVTFNTSVKSDTARRTVEKTMNVTINGEAAHGGWRWESDTVAYYRLPTYWPGNSTIKLDTHLKGVNVSDGVWGDSNSTHTWNTGNAMISTVNLVTHQLVVRKNGIVLKVIPITGGKPGYETRTGIKVILGHEVSRRMDAATGGVEASDPEYYNLVVQYAMRVTLTGEFLHAAPWSVASQGSANVSHGCVGMSTANAKWLFDNSEIGDVVEFTGNPRKMEWNNGIDDWNVPFNRWLAGATV
jgi:lipoprotein-anchoring transpeptidase ErfK/SrfK